MFDRTITISLIARRSRHFAGTRYLKRGCDEVGNVANEVETEQIVWGITPLLRHNTQHFCSFVQTRGSIPVFWSQDTSVTVPKPPIQIYKRDPFYSSAVSHFQSHFERYGAPVIILNLIRHCEKVARETILLDEYTQCIDFLNSTLPPQFRLEHIAWDFHQASKR